VLGDSLQGIASGQGGGMGGIAAIAAARQEAIGKRKESKEKDKKDRLLEAYAKKVEMSNPDLAAQIRGGFIDPADIIKGDIARERSREDFQWEMGQKEEAAKRERESSPEYQMLTQLFPDIYGQNGTATAGVAGQRAPAANVTPPAAGTGGAPVTTAALPPDPGVSQPPAQSPEAAGGTSRVGSFFGLPDLTPQEEVRMKAAIAASGGLSGGYAEANNIRQERAAAAEAQAKAAAAAQEGEQKVNKEQFDMSKDLRTEFTKLDSGYKSVEETAMQVDQIVSDPGMTPTDKVSVMYKFMKGLDPTGAVRESDAALAQSATSTFAQLEQMMKSISEGGTISDESVQQMADSLARMGNYARSKREGLANQYSGIAESSGVERERVFGPDQRGASMPRKPIGLGRANAKENEVIVPPSAEDDLKKYGGL